MKANFAENPKVFFDVSIGGQKFLKSRSQSAKNNISALQERRSRHCRELPSSMHR